MIVPILTEMTEILKSNPEISVCCHIDPDGDALGSMLGLGSALKQIGHKVHLVSPDGVPDNMRFLPGADEVVVDLPPVGKQSVVIAVDCGDIDRLGPVSKHLQGIKGLINIDHHFTNTKFGDINWVEPRACATTELLFHLICDMGVTVSSAIAICLYTGILTDTGGFRYQNTTAQTHKIAAQLVNMGADPWRISNCLYDTKPLAKIRLLQGALQRLELSCDGRIAWISLPLQLMQSCQTDDTSEIINYPRMIQGTELAILFTENEDGSVKVGLRSRETIDVSDLAKIFGGGGHARAAGCILAGPLSKAEQQVLTVAQGLLAG